MAPWAGAYPKVEVFDGTPYQVKSLGQVVLEALGKHTDLPLNKRLLLVDDLVAYIAWWGDGTKVTPGRSRPAPPPPQDLALLKSVVAKGRELFHQKNFGPCASCHYPGNEDSTGERIPLGAAAATFPAYVEAAYQVMSLEEFLSWHLAQDLKYYTPDSREITALAAYLADLAQGQRLKVGQRKPGPVRGKS